MTPPFRYAYVLSGRWRFQGGVKPPHSKALRAFSWFLGARQQTGMNDCSLIAPITMPQTGRTHEPIVDGAAASPIIKSRSPAAEIVA